MCNVSEKAEYTYEDALDYMNSLGTFGMMLGLTRIEKLVEVLGHPERDLRIIHIAGTNGKGSVGAFLASILMAAGYRTGRFVSPALFEYRERIQIDGEYIPKADFSHCSAVVREACRAVMAAGIEQPTQFEVDTAMAFVYFRQMKCDYVLLEVGLGGRMDSTNVIESSVLSVITSIGLDHTRVLGDTLTAIATEKAGIIKAGGLVVTAPQEPEALAVIRAQCAQMGAHLIEAGAPTLLEHTQADVPTFLEHTQAGASGHFDYTDAAPSGFCQSFSYGPYEHLKISMAGIYQPANAAVAVEAALALNCHCGANIKEQHIYDGLAAARWPGRFELLAAHSVIVADGAHNPDGARVLAGSLKAYFPGKRCILVMGVFADKDYQKILEIMSQCGDTIITHKPGTPRGLDSRKLAEDAAQYFKTVIDGENIKGAINAAQALASPEDVIVSFGSLSTIADLKAAVWQGLT